MSAAKRDRNSWHFYVIRTRLCRFQKSCPLVFTSLIRRLFTDFINSSRYSDFSHPNSKMKTTHCILIALSLCAVASSTAGCKYAVESYTTTDAMIVTEAAFIAQVSAECEDSPSNLYAEVEGRLLVAANAGPNKYQVRNLFTIQLWSFARSFVVILKFYNNLLVVLIGQLVRWLQEGSSWRLSREILRWGRLWTTQETVAGWRIYQQCNTCTLCIC